MECVRMLRTGIIEVSGGETREIKHKMDADDGY